MHMGLLIAPLAPVWMWVSRACPLLVSGYFYGPDYATWLTGHWASNQVKIILGMLVAWAFFIYLVWMWVIWVFCSSGKSKRTFVSWGVTVCRMWWALELVLSMAWGLGTTQRLLLFDSGWWRWSSSVNCSCQVGCFEFCFIPWFFFPSSTQILPLPPTTHRPLWYD